MAELMEYEDLRSATIMAGQLLEPPRRMVGLEG